MTEHGLIYVFRNVIRDLCATSGAHQSHPADRKPLRGFRSANVKRYHTKSIIRWEVESMNGAHSAPYWPVRIRPDRSHRLRRLSLKEVIWSTKS
jgi:hypothetical protein